VHAKVAKTNSSDHLFGQFCDDDSLFLKPVEELIGAADHAKTFVAHDVCGKINASLQRLDEIEYHNVLAVLIVHKELQGLRTGVETPAVPFSFSPHPLLFSLHPFLKNS
jgi:hypothetical protein